MECRISLVGSAPPSLKPRSSQFWGSRFSRGSARTYALKLSTNFPPSLLPFWLLAFFFGFALAWQLNTVVAPTAAASAIRSQNRAEQKEGRRQDKMMMIKYLLMSPLLSPFSPALLVISLYPCCVCTFPKETLKFRSSTIVYHFSLGHSPQSRGFLQGLFKKI